MNQSVVLVAALMLHTAGAVSNEVQTTESAVSQTIAWEEKEYEALVAADETAQVIAQRIPAQHVDGCDYAGWLALRVVQPVSVTFALESFGTGMQAYDTCFLPNGIEHDRIPGRPLLGGRRDR